MVLKTCTLTLPNLVPFVQFIKTWKKNSSIGVLQVFKIVPIVPYREKRHI